METWAELETACLACRGCSLCETRTQVVFGAGNPQAEVLLIGEAPGQQEDLTGTPFVGRGGKLLDDMLASVGIARQSVFIANMVKCRPPNNRDPLGVEADACKGWLERQIALLRPKLILCLGRVAAQRMIDKNFKITQEHGKWFQRDGGEIMAVFHPAALLRDPRRRPDTYADLQGLADKIRQRCQHTILNP